MSEERLREALDVLREDAVDRQREPMWRYGVRHTLGIVEAALAAPSRDAGLDVGRLARAMVAVEATRIESISPNLLKHIPGPDMNHWNEHASAVVAEYARLAADDGAPFPAGVNRADSEGEG